MYFHRKDIVTDDKIRPKVGQDNDRYGVFWRTGREGRWRHRSSSDADSVQLHAIQIIYGTVIDPVAGNQAGGRKSPGWGAGHVKVGPKIICQDVGEDIRRIRKHRSKREGQVLVRCGFKPE